MDTVTYPNHHVAHFTEEHFVPARVRTKDHPDLMKEYFVTWTPNVVVMDDAGKVHYRIEGFLPPDEFVAHLAIGLGKYLLDREEFERAAERFDEVAQRHQGANAAAEALYWLGVAYYKKSHDPAQLRSSWQLLAMKYPQSDWTTRCKIPG